MSDLVKILREGDRWDFSSGDLLSSASIMDDAADRIEQLERVLLLAREAVELGLENASQVAGEYHGAMAGYRQYRHDALDADVDMTKKALAAIDEALKG